MSKKCPLPAPPTLPEYSHHKLRLNLTPALISGACLVKKSALPNSGSCCWFGNVWEVTSKVQHEIENTPEELLCHLVLSRE